MDDFLREFEYLKYAVCDEHGIMIGVKDDSPEEIKKQYRDVIKYEKEHCCKF